MGNLTKFIGENYDATKEEQHSENSALPDGIYIVEVEKAEVKETSNKQGVGVKYQFNVLALAGTNNDYSGRKCFDWHNIEHTNKEARQIGRSKFNKVCAVSGAPNISDTSELTGKRLAVKIGKDKTRKDENEIKDYYTVEDGLKRADSVVMPGKSSTASQAVEVPSQQGQPQQQPSLESSGGHEKPAWMK